MKSFSLGRWGSQILPLTARQASLAPRQPTRLYNARWESTTAKIVDEIQSKPPRRRPARVVSKKTVKQTPLLPQTPLQSSFSAPSLSAQTPPPPPPPGQTSSSFGSSFGLSQDTLRQPSTSYGSVTPPLTQTAPPTSFPPTQSFTSHESPSIPPLPLESLPSPPVSAARTSAKLAALHSRLNLPSRFPLETLARTLVDKSADRYRNFNNYSMALLGNDLLGYYMGEYLICQYPRLPMAVLHAAQNAYVGAAALAAVTKDWGVEVAAEPGGEVNPGLLQFRRIVPGTPYETYGAAQARERIRLESDPTARPDDPATRLPSEVTTLEAASATFVRAVFGSMYMHSGAEATHAFFKAHILSRRLDIATLFTFTEPTRDLSRLCAREDFESPVARVIDETGRLSRVPVFVVGVFSGRDKLGEAAGSSLNEARFKASIHALKGWYLYSPKGRLVEGETLVPSMMEGGKGRKTTWVPAHIDDGEIVV